MIELKNIQTSEAASQETQFFTATIYLEGKKVGSVSNDGQGGCHSYSWLDREAANRIEQWAQGQDTAFNFEKVRGARPRSSRTSQSSSQSATATRSKSFSLPKIFHRRYSYEQENQTNMHLPG